MFAQLWVFAKCEHFLRGSAFSPHPFFFFSFSFRKPNAQMGKLKIHQQQGTEMYGSSHPLEKKGVFIQEMPQQTLFFFQGHACITNEQTCLSIKCPPEEHCIQKACSSRWLSAANPTGHSASPRAAAKLSAQLNVKPEPQPKCSPCAGEGGTRRGTGAQSHVVTAFWTASPAM